MILHFEKDLGLQARPNYRGPIASITTYLIRITAYQAKQFAFKTSQSN